MEQLSAVTQTHKDKIETLTLQQTKLSADWKCVSVTHQGANIIHAA